MQKIASKLGDFVAYAALRVVICVIQFVSIERCERCCELLAIVFHRWIGLRSKLVQENLKRVFPEWTPDNAYQTTGAMWKHLLLMVCEIAHAPRKIHRTNWYEHYRVQERKRILKVIVDPRAKIVVTGHFGNFELAGYINGLFGISSTTLARPLDNVYIHRFITKFRSLGGQHFLSKDGSAHEIQRLLAKGELLGLLADQDAGNRGCWVNFLGHPASCHKALALFTLSNQAPMLVCYNRRLSRPLEFEFVVTGVADPLEAGPHLENVQSLTQWYNDCLEAAIRRYPQQYWWLHRRWRDPPPRLQRASKLVKEATRELESKPADGDNEISHVEDQERAA
jgi:Kdo2-lipid IVA lauroyltransferase/acyltransferase